MSEIKAFPKKHTPLRYVGETGQTRRDDRALEHGELVAIPDHEVADHLETKLFEHAPAEAHITRKAKAPAAAKSGDVIVTAPPPEVKKES